MADWSAQIPSSEIISLKFSSRISFLRKQSLISTANSESSEYHPRAPERENLEIGVN